MERTGYWSACQQGAGFDILRLMKEQSLAGSPLGKPVGHTSTYTPSLLHSIARSEARGHLDPEVVSAMRGEDLWTAYEFSWLNGQGKPEVAGVRLQVPCGSNSIVESKSMKLYLNSFAQTRFDTMPEVRSTLEQDLSLAFRAPILVEPIQLATLNTPVQQFNGICLDDLDIGVQHYEREPDLLSLAGDVVVKEVLYTNLFRSVCPVTGQPDWASISIDYVGPAIHRESLLAYFISYRTHSGFHEAAIEQIYADILERCNPQQLSVYGRFLRRGGIDINPFRSNHEDNAQLCRLPRQ